MYNCYVQEEDKELTIWLFVYDLHIVATFKLTSICFGPKQINTGMKKIVGAKSPGSTGAWSSLSL